MKKFLFFTILIFSVNLYSQEITNSNIDSLKIESIKIFQDLFWLKPIKHYGWVTDYEKLYSKKEIKNLNRLITEFEKQTSNEIAIITLDSLRVTEENFDALSLRVANEWAIGKPEKNNGILIAISKKFRKIRIQNGIGIEKILSDFETKQIIENQFIPYFKEDDYYKGTYKGILEIIEKLK